MDFRWWRVLYSLGAGTLAGVCFSAPPLWFDDYQLADVLCRNCRVVSLVCSLPYAWISIAIKVPSGIKSFDAFLGVRFICGLGALLSLTALGLVSVVVVSPIVATTPLWNLLIAYLFLWEREKLNARTALGTVTVVGGTLRSQSAGKLLNRLTGSNSRMYPSIGLERFKPRIQ
jgi:drug/metabolite transporter (DMT)-like permease